MYPLLPIFALIVCITFCTQIQLISAPTPNEIQKINLLQSVCLYRQRTISIDKEKYKCMTPIKQIAAFKGDSKPRNNDNYAPPTIPHNLKLKPEAFQELELLKDNVGVVHYTKQFLYKYLHKKIVSQYDDQNTKYMNQKKVYENFTMGTYQKQTSASASSANPTVEELLAQEFAKAKIQEGKSLIYEFDYENAILHTVVPVYNKTIDKALIFQVTFHLDFSTLNLSSINPKLKIIDKDSLIFQKTFKAVPVSMYELQLIPKMKFEFEIVKLVSIQSTHLMPEHLPQLEKKIIPKQANIIFSPLVDEICSFNKDVGLRVRDTLLLTLKSRVQYMKYHNLYNKYMRERIQKINIGKQTIDITLQEQPEFDLFDKVEYMVVSIKDILGEFAYLLNEDIPSDWEIFGCSVIQQQKPLAYHGGIELLDDRSLDDAAKITRLQRIPLNHQLYNQQVIQFDYVGKALLKAIQPSKVIQGQELMCIAKIYYNYKDNQMNYNIPIALTIGEKFDQQGIYYHFYPTAFSWSDSYYTQTMNLVQKRFVCLKYEGDSRFFWDSNRDKMYQRVGKYHQFYKLSKGQKIKLPQPEQEVQKMYVIELSEDCILELETESLIHKNLKPSKFIFTLQQIFKIGYFQHNYTKYEATENSYYQNLTSTAPIAITNYGIFRFGDYLKFPRMLINTNTDYVEEVLMRFIVKFGYAFIRVIKIPIDKLNQNYLAGLSERLYPKSSFHALNRPGTSIATENRFKGGDYCAGAIKKNREIFVKIKCGEPWLKIDTIKEVSPCSYEVHLLSQFLCESGIIFANKPNTMIPFKGAVCIPERLFTDRYKK